MRSIRLMNFRSLEDTGRVELRPITVLVGANSSGKSSFLRFFPLLRQTVETPTQSPLLWYTDTGYVDFGDFSQTVRRGADPKIITVEFEIKPRQQRGSWSRFTEGFVKVSVLIYEQGGRAQACEYTITSNDDTCRLTYDESDRLSRFDIGDIDVLSLDPDWHAVRAGVGLVSGFSSSELAPRSVFPSDAPDVNKELFDALRPFMNRRTTAEAAAKLVAQLRYGKADEIKADLLSLRDAAEWKRGIAAHLSIDQFRKIRSLLYTEAVPVILRGSRSSFERFAKGVKYLGPFRATPERFYRQQDVSVHQIEPHGENLAMFLRALPEQSFQNLSSFVHEHLGFHLRIRTEGSHVSILIVEDNGAAFNLIDMGYGFSQVLPVVAQLWATGSGFQPSERTPPTTLLALEQPELHLHPHHQARLADMLVGVIKASRSTSEKNPDDLVRIIVETHSEALINRLGELVEEGSFSAGDISVLLFEKDARSGVTTVRQSDYSADGTLQNWPIGFFAP